jgi:hypothetical protein
MATRDLGTKYTCFKCAAKFYDMKKAAPLCPKCGVDQRDMPPPTKSSRRAAAPVAPKLELAEPEEVDEEGEDDEDDDEEDDA